MITTNTDLIILTGDETEIKFLTKYTHFWCATMGDSDVLISMKPIVPECTDGVIAVPAGGKCDTSHGYYADRLYAIGNGKIQVMGTHSAHCPFNSSPKGGGTGYVLPKATETVLGGVKVDGTTIAADENGTVSVKDNLHNHTMANISGLQSALTDVYAEIAGAAYTHPTESGNKHIPSGGSSGQILRWSADGTAVWGIDDGEYWSRPELLVHGTGSNLNFERSGPFRAYLVFGFYSSNYVNSIGVIVPDSNGIGTCILKGDIEVKITLSAPVSYVPVNIYKSGTATAVSHTVTIIGI